MSKKNCSINKNTIENVIIVVSQVNHLHTARYFTEEYSITNAHLLYLYNGRYPFDIGSYAELLDWPAFLSYEAIAIPHNIQTPNLYKLIKLKKTYLKVLNKFRPKTVYLFSQDRQYNIMIECAREFNAQVIYIEDGLGTYSEKNYLNIIKFDKKRLLDGVLRVFSSDTILKKIISVILTPIRILYGILSIVDIQIVLIKAFNSYNSFFNLTPKFNSAYVSFPDLAKRYIDSEKYNKIDMLKCKTANNYYSNLNHDTSKTILFISQKIYTKKVSKDYYKILFSLLQEIAIKNQTNIDITLHPNESRNDAENSIKFFTSLSLLPHMICTAESLVCKQKYRLVFGVYSTSLVYLANGISDLSVYSIGNILQNKLIDASYNAELICNLKNGLEALAKFQCVRQYDLGEITLNTTINIATHEYACKVDHSARKINIGAGKWSAPGWINLDKPSDWYATRQTTPFIPYDARTDALPFPDDSIDVVYCSHVIEHLELQHCQNLFFEVNRVLKSGGVFRLCCPDAEFLYHVTKLAPSYWQWNRILYKMKDQATPSPLPLDFLIFEISSQRCRQYKHRLDAFPYEKIEAMYNTLSMTEFLDSITAGCTYREQMPGDHIQWFSFEKLTSMLKSVGLHALRSKFGGSIFIEMQDTAVFDTTTPQKTLYIDCIKN